MQKIRYLTVRIFCRGELFATLLQMKHPTVFLTRDDASIESGTRMLPSLTKQSPGLFCFTARASRSSILPN